MPLSKRTMTYYQDLLEKNPDRDQADWMIRKTQRQKIWGN
jgi:hypothetical protein